MTRMGVSERDVEGPGTTADSVESDAEIVMSSTRDGWSDFDEAPSHPRQLRTVRFMRKCMSTRRVGTRRVGKGS